MTAKVEKIRMMQRIWETQVKPHVQDLMGKADGQYAAMVLVAHGCEHAYKAIRNPKARNVMQDSLESVLRLHDFLQADANNRSAAADVTKHRGKTDAHKIRAIIVNPWKHKGVLKGEKTELINAPHRFLSRYSTSRSGLRDVRPPEIDKLELGFNAHYFVKMLVSGIDAAYAMFLDDSSPSQQKQWFSPAQCSSGKRCKKCNAERYGFAPIQTLSDHRLTDADAILAQQLKRHRENGFTASDDELLEFGRWTARHLAQKNEMRQDPAALLRQLLLNQGHARIGSDSRAPARSFVDEMKAAGDLVYERDAQNTLFNRPLSSRDYRGKLLESITTEDDRYGRERDRIELDTGQYLTRDLYDRYHRRAARRHLQAFERLFEPEEEAVRSDREQEERRTPLHRRGNFAQRWRLEQGILCGLAQEAGIPAGLPTRDLLIALRGHMFFKDEIETATAPVLSQHPEWRAYGRSDLKIRSTSENLYICAKNILLRGGVKLLRTKERANNPRTGLREHFYHICPEALDQRLADLDKLRIHRATQIHDETEPECNPLRLARLAEAQALERVSLRDKPSDEDWADTKAAGLAAFDAALAQSCNIISPELQVCASGMSEYDRWRAQIEAIPI